MNRDFWSALLSWWPFLLFMAVWFLFGRTRILSLMRPRALSEGNAPESRCKYRVLYHVGDSVSVRTKALEGRLALTQDVLKITGPSPVELPVRELRSAELFRLHGLGRCIRISHDSGTLYVSVIRFLLFGYFGVINFFGTGDLARRLRYAIGAEVRTL
jgi:hypothetical protein